MGTSAPPLDSQPAPVVAEALSVVMFPMTTPTTDYRRSAHRVPERPLKGLDAAVNWCIGKYQRRGGRLKDLEQEAEAVEACAGEFTGLSVHDLQQKLLGFRDHF